MQVTQVAADGLRREFKVTVPASEIESRVQSRLERLAKTIRLPGFRPGKAPEAVVRKRFNDAIRQTMLEELLRESWETAKTSESLKPIADPSVRNLKFEEGSPIEFDLLVEVRPEIKLERTGGFRIERRIAAVPDSAVTERLASLQEAKAAWIPVTGEKPAPGQMVRVEVAPIEDGTAGTAQPYDLVLGQNQAIPEVEERIMEMVPGGTRETEVRFPEDHPEESRRGQTRRVRIALHEVKRQELPPLDDAFAREMGDFENLDALRAAVRRDLEREAERDADAQVRQALLAQVVEANNITAPESLVHRLMHGYAEIYRIPREQLPAFEGQFHEIAESQVKRDLVLDAVVEQQGLRASESEIDARVQAMAEARGVPAGELYASLQKSNRLAELERGLTEEKAYQYLLGQSTVDEATT
jgi:trigger factor